MKKLVFDTEHPNGALVDMTAEEEAEMQANDVPTAPSESDSFTTFIAGLASSDINSIAKIRALAKQILDSTGGGVK